ncbi:hypothetical protein FRC0141_00069 [Corynebacterium diphtheriae]|nr:hypothetical protein B11Q_00039 [Corynebacterium diphtheriae]WJY86377.1 hypothetical protein CDIPH_00205 [Corynebacterium diphtheriae]CAB0485734.1 hypothetical protein CIP102550_00016 [Corynebacterium diphtheriae]CAB0487508.1 hypothetical protein CIP101352_00117 [Corynebacterium diphtheriae]CAB0528096.1 hypothetical protein CIP107503_02234 [Corynebacterium diphtheriae]
MLTEVQFYLIKLVTYQKLGNRFSIFTPLTHPINYNAVIPVAPPRVFLRAQLHLI